ncbi:MAG: Rpn family recombination-promoting nuclease/putative transposase, partial [Prevotellaceae bacterium]|nr:Rpn family recombination-promoting nuclease/putative transposase [Prevotellaceae bacterium]
TTTDYYHDYKIVNVASTTKQIEGLELVFIELPKFHPTNRAEKKLYDLWLMFLTQIKDAQQDVPSELLSETVTKEAVELLEQNSYTKEELAAYDHYWDTVSTARTVQVDARKEGEAEGLEKGEAIGLEKGEAIGLEKGREEAFVEIVLAGSRDGLLPEQLQAITGFSREKIEKILADGKQQQ